MEAGRPRSGFGTALVAVLFIALVSLVIFDRGRIEVDFAHLSAGGAAYYHPNLPYFLPSCMRIGTSILGYGIEKLLLGLSGIYFSGDAAYRLFAPEVVAHQGMYAWQRVVLDPARMQDLVVPIAATVLLRALCLGAILWLALRFFSATWERATFLLVTFGALLGWPVSLVLGFFSLMSTVVDWPHHHFLYVYFASPYDFGSVGFLYVLMLMLARPTLPSPAAAALLAPAGQLVFENLGLVTGVAFAIVAWARMPHGTAIARLARAASYLVAAGLACIAVAALVIAQCSAPEGDASPATKVLEYFIRNWHMYGRNNLEWWRVLVADSISILVFPMIFGAALGLGAWLVRNDHGPSADAVGRQFLAACGVAAGFIPSLVPGFFVSGMTSDIFRQIAPLACVTVLFAARGTAVLLRRTSFGPRP